MQLDKAVVALFDYPVDNICAKLPPPSSPIWDRAPFRQRVFRAHAVTRSIVFNWLDDGWHPGAPFVPLRADYPPSELRDCVWACADRLAGHFGGAVAKLMLAELASGGAVRNHVDLGESMTHVHRCHVPIVTDTNVDFFVDGERFYLEPGVAYEFDNTRLHGVKNRSAQPRVHLICDIMPSTYLS